MNCLLSDWIGDYRCSSSEVKETGWNALLERLGVAGATLFVLEYEKIMEIILRKERNF
jgi:hypothetical protein